MKAGLGAFAVGAAIILVFSKGDPSMQRVGAVLVFAGGLATLVFALIDRWTARRPPPRA